MADTMAKPQKRRRLEHGVRRSLELFLLTVSLVAGLAIVGGCGGLAIASSEDGAAEVLIPMLGGGVLLVGVVYLATSMSRDVRILKQKLLEQEQPSKGSEDSSAEV